MVPSTLRSPLPPPTRNDGSSRLQKTNSLICWDAVRKVPTLSSNAKNNPQVHNKNWSTSKHPRVSPFKILWLEPGKHPVCIQSSNLFIQCETNHPFHFQKNKNPGMWNKHWSISKHYRWSPTHHFRLPGQYPPAPLCRKASQKHHASHWTSDLHQRRTKSSGKTELRRS